MCEHGNFQLFMSAELAPYHRNGVKMCGWYTGKALLLRECGSCGWCCLCASLFLFCQPKLAHK